MAHENDDALRQRVTDALQAVTAAIGSQFVHRKTGHVYRLKLVALRESDCVPLVIYGRDGVLLTWARPLEEMLDGRFVAAEGK